MRKIMEEHGDNWLFVYHDVMTKEENNSTQSQTPNQKRLVPSKRLHSSQSNSVMQTASGSIDINDLQNLTPNDLQYKQARNKNVKKPSFMERGEKLDPDSDDFLHKV